MSNSLEVIFDAGGIKASYQPANSDLVVVRFSEAEPADPAASVIGARRAAAPGFGVLDITDTGSTWFCDPLVGQAIAAINDYGPLRSGQRRLTFGASMGGYAALKYGRVLGAFAAVAAAPQISIEPARVAAFDRRFQRFFEPDLHEQMEITEADLCPRNFVLFDPASAEVRRHVSALSSMPRVQPIVAPFSGGQGIAFFTQPRIFEQAVRLAAEKLPDPRRFRQMIRLRRRKSADYWFNRADFMRKHRPSLPDRGAFFSYREAIRLNAAPAEHPDTVKLLVGYADALLDAGRRAEAQPVLEFLTEVWQRGHNVAGLLALTTKSAQVKEAHAGVVKAKTKPEQAVDPEVLLEQAKVRFLAGDLPGANEAADAARPLAGTNIMAWRHLRWMYLRLHRDVEALEAEAVLVTLDAMPKNMGRNPKLPDPE